MTRLCIEMSLIWHKNPVKYKKNVCHRTRKSIFISGEKEKHFSSARQQSLCPKPPCGLKDTMHQDIIIISILNYYNEHYHHYHVSLFYLGSLLGWYYPFKGCSSLIRCWSQKDPWILWTQSKAVSFCLFI